MHVSVGPLVYSVHLVAGYVRHEGEDCLGLCDNEAQRLYVSDRTTAAQRVAVFCHEYMEAWLYHFGGEEKSKEGYCDVFGLAMTQFVQQFAPDFAIDPRKMPVESPPAEDGARDANARRVVGLHVTERIVPSMSVETGDDGRAWRVRIIEPA